MFVSELTNIMNQILKNEDARKQIKIGIDAVCDPVLGTIGPRGGNVIIDGDHDEYEITNDGKTIADHIRLPDKFHNLGTKIGRKVSNKTNDLSGDGRSTALALLKSLTTEGMKRLDVGISGNDLRNGIERATADAVKILETISIPADNKRIIQVATVSSESEDIGNIIAEAIEQVGKDGKVSTEDSNGTGVELKVVQGVEFDSGFISPYMITDTDRMEAIHHDSPIVVTDRRITSFKELKPLLVKLADAKYTSLVLIAEDVDGEALAAIVMNRLQGGINVLAVKAPGFGDAKKDTLIDIATMVGAKFLSKDSGGDLSTLVLEDMGAASRVLTTKETTLISGGKGTPESVAERVSQMKIQKESSTSNYTKENLELRIANLSGGVAMIRVGASTETEMKYLRKKIKDAVASAKAAVAEGVVPGGGIALMLVSKKLKEEMPTNLSLEQRLGYEIVINALMMPLKQIVKNSGQDDASAVIVDINKREGNAGFDARKNEVVDDIVEAGIVDAAKVTRLALEHAAGEASMFLTTDLGITLAPDKK